MKQTLIALFLLAAIAGKGQIPDTTNFNHRIIPVEQDPTNSFIQRYAPTEDWIKDDSATGRRIAHHAIKAYIVEIHEMRYKYRDDTTDIPGWKPKQKDTGVIGSGKRGWGESYRYRNNQLSFMLYTDNRPNNLYANGDITIEGDTVAIIRDLAGRLDSMTNRYYKAIQLSERLFDAGLDVPKGEEYRRHCMDLLYEWVAFKTGKAWPAKKSKKKRRDSL